MLLKGDAHLAVGDVARGDVDEIRALDLGAESRTQRRQFHWTLQAAGGCGPHSPALTSSDDQFIREP